MEAKLRSKIHNKFLIEVKDVITNEIIQRGYAENIVLDTLKTSNLFMSNSSTTRVGLSIQFGKGTGVLSVSRTTLFNRLGGKNSEVVNYDLKQAPNTSFSTKKIVIAPEEYVGETFTEVGIGGQASSTTIYTHALIKDSEGNDLALGPKTDTQEITIYSIVYFQPDFEDGITLYGQLLYATGSITEITKEYNGLLLGALMLREVEIRNDYGGFSGRIFVNGVANDFSGSGFSSQVGNVLNFKKYRLDTSMQNGVKIKKIAHGSASNTTLASTIELDLEVLAENSSTLWIGYEFDNTPISIGDGNTTIFNLTWDEAWITRPYRVYIDGIEVTSGFTFNTGNITFNIAPADQAVITADYWVKYAPKDVNHVLDINLNLTIGEGTPL